MSTCSRSKLPRRFPTAHDSLAYRESFSIVTKYVSPAADWGGTKDDKGVVLFRQLSDRGTHWILCMTTDVGDPSSIRNTFYEV